jgi:hypothetical protein
LGSIKAVMGNTIKDILKSPEGAEELIKVGIGSYKDKVKIVVDGVIYEVEKLPVKPL